MKMIDSESFGFFKAAAFSPEIRVADCFYNAERITDCIKQADEAGAAVALFPQLAVTGVSCAALFEQNFFTEKAAEAVLMIAEKTETAECVSVIGFPLRVHGKLFNAAAVLFRGEVIAAVPLCSKNLFADVFVEHENRQEDEKNGLQVVNLCGKAASVKFGKDILFKIRRSGKELSFCIGGGSSLQTPLTAGADLVLQPLAENSFAGKEKALRDFYSVLSGQNACGFVFANAGAGESSADYVFAGECGIFEAGAELCFSSLLAVTREQVTGKGEFIADSGQESALPADEKKFCMYTVSVCAEMDLELIGHFKLKRKIGFEPKEFLPQIIICGRNGERKNSRFLRSIPQNPFISSIGTENPSLLNNYLFQIFFLQAQGLHKRLSHLKIGRIILGISGGIDSAAALLSAVFLFGLTGRSKKDIYAFTMPGLGTTAGTKKNAVLLAELLNCTVEEISISAAVRSHFKDIGHSGDKPDTVFENAQARERTQILMDKANQLGGIVLGTGDLSEAALGWSTFNGDHMSMYSINSGIPKTLLRLCIGYAAENADKFLPKDASGKKAENADKFKQVLNDVLQTPISPELLPAENGKVSQYTEEILGSYILHDFFIYHVCVNGFAPKKVLFLAERAFNGIPHAEILKRLKLFYSRFFSSQFKRNCCPDGAAVLDFSFSPRTSWKMPSDTEASLWLSELESME